MPAPVPRELTLRDPEQIRMLASPVRAEMLQVLANHGEMSARQIAAHMGRDPRTLHYHLRQLVAAGLVRRTGKQSMGPRSEAMFESVATSFRVDRSTPGEGTREAILKSVRVGLRLAERKYAAALADPACAAGDRREHLEMSQQNVRLTPSQFRAVRRLLHEARRLAREHHDPDRGEWVTITTVVTPDQDREG